MQLKNAEVALTVEIRGAQASRGRYIFTPKLDENKKPMLGIFTGSNGKKSNFPLGKLDYVQPRRFHKASHYTVLNNKFVQHAISEEGKPEKMGKTRWYRMPAVDRLKLHVTKYAKDMFPGCEFKYSIIG